ncbi:hypothetical protein FRB91_004282 [Serendipita sp. 411]|nr:hypothetical protein FRC19_001654 [Serendipita sp. 401]KAG8831673.1 hypothetical protein FRC18_006198 [Serendipita sp. 400]KAG8844387.1 hypothetical protein FRC20_003548 [Serendipita sp. 405]KAG8853851.1 hypothetical protein FRB91_004282 [Serendipita sp. 411]KAG9054995.1 hypothetical protein FS842_003446 [Serendipita sp. 407]
MHYHRLLATLLPAMTLSFAAPIFFEEVVTVRDPAIFTPEPELVLQEMGSHISRIQLHAQVDKREIVKHDLSALEKREPHLDSRSLGVEINEYLVREVDTPPVLTGPDFGRMPKQEFLSRIYGMLPRIELPPSRPEVIITEFQL